MDVKCGRGAFMKTLPEARALAESIQRVGTANGLTVRTLITDMDTPLGRAVGHSLEVIEAIETLKGHGPDDFLRLCVCQAAEMVDMAGISDISDVVSEAMASGTALEKFRLMVKQQGGDPRVVDDYSLLPTAPHRTIIPAPADGYVADIDPYAVGIAVAHLGGGRKTAADRIDLGVGVVVKAKRGEQVQAGEPVFEVHHGDTGVPEALDLLRGCFSISDSPPPANPLILEELR